MIAVAGAAPPPRLACDCGGGSSPPVHSKQVRSVCPEHHPPPRAGGFNGTLLLRFFAGEQDVVQRSFQSWHAAVLGGGRWPHVSGAGPHSKATHLLLPLFLFCLLLPGWVATLVVAAITAAAFAAQGIYAPNRNMGEQRYTTATYLTSTAWSVAQVRGGWGEGRLVRGVAGLGRVLVAHISRVAADLLADVACRPLGVAFRRLSSQSTAACSLLPASGQPGHRHPGVDPGQPAQLERHLRQLEGEGGGVGACRCMWHDACASACSRSGLTKNADQDS